MAKNQGQHYEESIRNILRGRNLLPDELADNDAGFFHQGVAYYLEIKNKQAPDFGQKGLTWSSTESWQWREKDIMTDLFDQAGLLLQINRSFVPKKYTVAPDRLTPGDKAYDQTQFKRHNIPLNDPKYVYEFYARKKCYYIQIEGKGFYYLKRDAAKLNVPQFIPQLTLRMRAKTHHSIPLYEYGFFAVLQAHIRTLPASPYDLEEKIGSFPPLAK